jgi:hypothetical protein
LAVASRSDSGRGGGIPSNPKIYRRKRYTANTPVSRTVSELIDQYGGRLVLEAVADYCFQHLGFRWVLLLKCESKQSACFMIFTECPIHRGSATLGHAEKGPKMNFATEPNFQIREEHWVIADLIGKGRHIRTVPVPEWAKRTVDHWINVADVADGPIFRRVNRLGKVWGDRITKAIWHIVKGAAVKAGCPQPGWFWLLPLL